MDESQLEQTFRATSWQQICHTTQSSVTVIAASCSRVALGLMQDVNVRFCSQEVPTTQEELSRRFTQATGHSALIQAIAFADLRARQNPPSSNRRLAALRQLAERDLPKEAAGVLALLSQISAISAM